MSNKELTGIIADYGQYVRDFIGRSVSNEQDCEDIMQEVWLLLCYRGTDNVDRDTICGYLRCVILSVKAEYYRRVSMNVYTKHVADFEYERLSPHYDSHSSFDTEYFQMAVRQAARHLSPKHRQWVIDHYVNGRSITEIAYKGGVGNECVRQVVAAMIPKVKRVYKQYV